MRHRRRRAAGARSSKRSSQRSKAVCCTSARPTARRFARIPCPTPFRRPESRPLATMRELYVYYRVDAAQAPRTSLQLAALRAELAAAWPPLRMRVLRRDDAGNEGTQTWMEIYTMDAGTQGAGVDRE